MPKTNRYAKLDPETFDRILADVINEHNPRPADLLSIPGVYEILSEHYNNDVLSAYDDEQATDDDTDDDEADADRTMDAQPHCAICGCDLHDGKCPEGHAYQCKQCHQVAHGPDCDEMICPQCGSCDWTPIVVRSTEA